MPLFHRNKFRKEQLVWMGLGGLAVVLIGVALIWKHSGPPGGGVSLRFELNAPRDRAVLHPPHRFSWQRVSRSTLYHFYLYEVNRNPVWSALVKDTTVVVPRSVMLLPGSSYLWRVEAILPGETTIHSDLRTFILSR
jgi:hypothetical protein